MSNAYHEVAASRRGGALTLSLIVVTLIAGLGAGLIQMQASITQRHAHGIDTKRALYVAEAGIAEAFHALSLGQSGNVGTPEKPAAFGHGLFWVEAAELPDGWVVLNSTGLCGTGRFAVSTVVEPRGSNLASSAVFGGTEIRAKAGIVIDSWDPADGPYDPVAAAKRSRATISSNGDIEIQGDLGLGPTIVRGDVNAGPLAIATIEPGVTVTGATANASRFVVMPAIPPPDLPPLEFIGSTVSGEGSYGELVVEDRTLTLEGPLTLVLDRLELKDYALLEINAVAGDVVLYVRGELKTDDKAQVVNVPGATGEFAVLVGDPLAEKPGDAKIELKSSGEFNGILYAPNREIVVRPSLRVFGALVGDVVKLEEGVRLTFLEDFGTGLDVPGATGNPKLLSWRRIELPDDPLVNSRLDARTMLELLGRESTVSSEAHLENEVLFKYEDAAGDKQEELVNLDDIDWSNVSKVKSLAWKNPWTGDMLKLKNVEQFDPLLLGG